MTIPTSGDPRRRDDRHLMERIAELRRRMREKGIQERRVDWRDLARATPPPAIWDTVPTGTGLVKRLAEPLRLLFDAARMFVLSGPTPEVLAVRGADMGPQAVPLDPSEPPSVPLEWSLPAEGDAPMIKIRVSRRDSGEVMLNFRVPDLPPAQVRVDLREMYGPGSFRGPLDGLVAGNIAVGPGAWTVRLTFLHKAHHPVREIPLDIGVLPDE